MPYDKRKHHRRSIRLPGYDYRSPGAYFVTICVHGGECLLGEVVEGEMRLNEWGQIAWDAWQALPTYAQDLMPDAFVVMPNHVHGIVVIADTVGAQQVGSQSPATPPAVPLQRPRTHVQPGSLGAIVRSYKSSVTKRINRLRDMPGVLFWQRNYWEHVIRNEGALERVREYIENNPARWAEDQLHPDAPPNQFNRWQP